MKVSAKTRSSRRSIPGSCCGLLNSAKLVTRRSLCCRCSPDQVGLEIMRRLGICRNLMFYNWIVTAFYERVAAQQTPDRVRPAAEQPVSIDGFHRILGARRHIAAGRQKQW